MKKYKTIKTLFSFEGFRAQQRLQGILGDNKGRVVELKRQKKEASVQDVKRAIAHITIKEYAKCEIWMYWDGVFIYGLNKGELIVLGVEV